MKPVTLALKFRAFAISALTILVAGCAQQQPPATATKTKNDCFSRFSGPSYEYILLEHRGPYVQAVLEDARQRGKDELPPLSFRIHLIVKPNDLIVKPNINHEQVKTKTDAWNHKLDEIEARVEAGKAQLGECFGNGYYGKWAAKTYARAKMSIATARARASNYLGEARAATVQAALVERWRADNASHLKRKAGNADLEIVRVARSYFGGVRPRVTVAVTNTTSTTILRPRNQRVWLSDSFGNTFELTSVKPKYYRTGGQGIRPGETEVFELEFADMPLENAKSVRIAVEPGTYGQSQWAVFDIPAEVFFRGMVGRSQDHQ